MDEDILAEKQVTVRPICEKPMTALVGDGNQSNQHQTEIPSEPEKSFLFPPLGRSQGHHLMSSVYWDWG